MGLKQFFQEGAVELGCDEAGRGCLAGPVYAAAVILDPEKKIDDLNDSKQLNEEKREVLRKQIEQDALCWAVASASAAEIDKINILNASFLAMHKDNKKIKLNFDHLLIDGNRFKPYKKHPYHCIIKGDAIYKSIAAASILAKTHRDNYMYKIAEDYPSYDWINNKGYPTKKHRLAIQKNGPCVYHRKKFKLLPDQMQFNF